MEQLLTWALKNKIRFQSSKGDLSLEDLFDLPLSSSTKGVSLDNVAIIINTELKAQTEQSFVNAPSSVATTLQAKLDIVKYIIAIKQEEQRIRKEAADKLARKRQLDGIIAEKQNAALSEMSLEELQKLREQLV